MEKFKFSNFQPSPIRWGEMVFPTVEHFFQCMKVVDSGERAKMLQMTPGQAKRHSRKVECRPDWEEIKVGMMRIALRKKFAPGTLFAQQLLETPDEELVEWNWWHDNFWGVCQCENCCSEGSNVLGELLRTIKQELLTNQES